MATSYVFGYAFTEKAKKLLAAIFDTSTGHDHDGVNSKAVSFVGAYSLANGKIPVGNGSNVAAAVTPSGDVTMTNLGVVAIGAKKVVEGMVAIASGKILVGQTGGEALAVTPSGDATISAAGVVAIGAAKVTPEMCKAAVNTRVLTYKIEALAAGVDIASRKVLVVPAGQQYTLTKASIVPDGASSGIDAGNASVHALTDGTNTIVTKQYDDSPTYPAANAQDDLGALDETHKVLAADEALVLNVTNGATAATPGALLQIEYTVETAA